MLQKVRKQGIRIWDERTFWHEIINKSLIPTLAHFIGLPKVGIKLLLSHARMFSRPKFLFLVSLLFVALLNPKFNPYLLFKFLIFYHSSIYSEEVGHALSAAKNIFTKC